MINIYAPVYDTILLVPAAALVARSLCGRSKREQAALQLWLIALWLVPWLTQSWADYLQAADPHARAGGIRLLGADAGARQFGVAGIGAAGRRDPRRGVASRRPDSARPARSLR